MLDAAEASLVPLLPDPQAGLVGFLPQQMDGMVFFGYGMVQEKSFTSEHLAVSCFRCWLPLGGIVSCLSAWCKCLINENPEAP